MWSTQTQRGKLWVNYCCIYARYKLITSSLWKKPILGFNLSRYCQVLALDDISHNALLFTAAPSSPKYIITSSKMRYFCVASIYFKMKYSLLLPHSELKNGPKHYGESFIFTIQLKNVPLRLFSKLK